MNTQTHAATAFAATSTIVVVLANDPVAFAKAFASDSEHEAGQLSTGRKRFQLQYRALVLVL